MAPKPRIRYVDGSCPLTIALIHSWARGDIVPVSGGSGLKDYVKNEVWSLFAAKPEIDRIAMVRGNGPTFYLLRTEGQYWFDVTGKQVVTDALEAS